MKLLFISLLLTVSFSLQATDIDQKEFYLPNTEIDITSYSIGMNVPAIEPNQFLAMDLKIVFNVLKPIQFLKLHASKSSMVIESVKVDGFPSQSHFINDWVLNIHSGLLLPGKHFAKIVYKITPTQLNRTTGLFITNGVLSVEDWPYFTRQWVPSNDSPSDPAKFEIRVALPLQGPLASYSAMSNGKLISRDFNVYHWKMKNEMPTYGLNLVVGDYVEKKKTLFIDPSHVNNDTEAIWKTDWFYEVPLALYMQSTNTPETIDQQWKKTQTDAKSLAFFSSILGMYHFEKLGFIEAKQRFNMEYPSLITGLEASVHEIAHHWFGNQVFIKHWGDFWISEGFTTYLDGLYREIYLLQERKWLDKRDKYFNFSEKTDPYEIFDNAPYVTGASSLHALRMKINNACLFTPKSNEDYNAIFNVIKSIYQNYKYRPLGTNELITFLRYSLGPTLASKAHCLISQKDIDTMINHWSFDWFNLVP